MCLHLEAFFFSFGAHFHWNFTTFNCYLLKLLTQWILWPCLDLTDGSMSGVNKLFVLSIRSVQCFPGHSPHVSKPPSVIPQSKSLRSTLSTLRKQADTAGL